MIDPTDWSVEFYTDESGAEPVQQFIDALDEKTQARLIWSLEQLRIRNVRAREPLVRQIEGKLWELREESRTNIYRLFYFLFTGRRIVILHGFQKKSQKTPPGEIAIALRRMADYMARKGGEIA